MHAEVINRQLNLLRVSKRVEMTKLSHTPESFLFVSPKSHSSPTIPWLAHLDR